MTDTVRGFRERVRPLPLAAALAFVLAAALASLAVSASTDLFFAISVPVAVLFLRREEGIVVSVAGLGFFMATLAVDDELRASADIPLIIGLFVAALILANLDRGHEPRASRRIPQEAGVLGLVATDPVSSLDLTQPLGTVARQLGASLGVSRCVILLAEGPTLKVAAATGMVGDGTQRGRRVEILPWETVRALREPLVVTPDTPGVDRELATRMSLDRALVLPLLSRDTLLGVVTLDEPGRRARFADKQVRAAMAVAAFAALMVDNARLNEEQTVLAADLRERSLMIEALLRMGNELRSVFEIDEVLQKVANTVIEALGYREAAIYLYDEEAEVYRARVALGGSSELDGHYLEAEFPRAKFEWQMRPEFRLGNSYYRSVDRFPMSDAEKALFQYTDLGPRAEGEWQSGDGLFVPLLSRDNVPIGVLDVYDPVDRRVPTLESVRSLEIFANQAGIAIENAMHYASLQVQERRLERQLQSRHELLRVSESVLSTLDEKVVFQAIADKLGQLVEYDTLAISKVDWAARRIDTVFAVDEYAEELMATPMRLDEGLTGWVVTNDEAILVNEAHLDPRGVLVPGTEPDPQASIIVPLRVMGKVIGVLDLDRLRGATFTEEELELVKPFASLAAIAIENASLYEQSQERAATDALTGLYNHGHFQEALEREVRRSERYGETFALLMMDLDHFKQVNDRYGHPRGDQILRRVSSVLRATARESDYIARYGGEEFALLLPRTSSEEARALAERIRERVGEVPVAREDDFSVSASIGVADFPACGLEPRTVLGAADTALLWAKRRGRNCVMYYRDVHEMVGAAPLEADEAGGHWRPGLEMLAAAVDAKASFRERHGEAVAEMVRQLALVAGRPAEEVAGFEVAARLHDVGKVGLAAELLEKGDALTGEEEAEVRRHVEVGVDILVNADAPRGLHPIVRHHHERWDGGGYPDGLAGEAIPLGARMVAICDAFQAMISDRPYRGAHSLDEARNEIRREAGGQFDPALAELFLDRCAASGADVPVDLPRAPE